MNLRHGPGEREKNAEMGFPKTVKGCTREDGIRNESIGHELQIYSLKDKLYKTGIKWREYIAKMKEDRQPKAIVRYKLKDSKL
jgi:hypothetical protein